MSIAIRFAFLALFLNTIMVGSAIAEEPSYSYAEFGHLRFDDHEGDLLNGLGVNLSVKLPDHWFGQFAYSTAEDENALGDLIVKTLDLGLGYENLYFGNTSLYALANITQVDRSVALNADVDDVGFSTESGLRYRPLQWFELHGFVRYTDVGAISFITGGLGTVFHFTNNLGATVNLTYDDDDDMTTYASLRLSF